MRLILCILATVGMVAQTNQVMVISHRGEHLHHGENTLSGFEAAFDAGADYIEADVRTTSDGKLVLMHDRTVNRTTKGTGEVANLSFDQIRELKVPAFEEALALARRAGGNIYVDSKAVSAEDLIRAVEGEKMQDHVAVYAGPPLLKAVEKLRPAIKLMPEARDTENLKSLLGMFKLHVVAFDAKDFDDATIQIAREAKLQIFVDRLGAADNPVSWQDAIDRGATGIQTDHPAELVQYLRERGMHR